jgi:hypothetical protein
MKYILLALLVYFSLMNSNAQAPQGIPYQSVIRNGSGALLINQAVNVRFSIHDSTALGTIVYQETHTTTTSAAAMLILTIGQGTPVTGTFSSINWGNGAKFMQVELDASGGSNYTDLGTQQMMSVPYALYAEKSASNDVNIPNPKILAGSFNKNGNIQMGSGYTVSKNGSEYTITFNDSFATTPVLQGNLVGYTDLKNPPNGDYKITDATNKLIKINTGDLVKSNRFPTQLTNNGSWNMAKSYGEAIFALKSDSTLWKIGGVYVKTPSWIKISNNKFTNFTLSGQNNIFLALSSDSTLWCFNDTTAYQISNLKWKQILNAQGIDIFLSNLGQLWKIDENGNLFLWDSNIYESITSESSGYPNFGLRKIDGSLWAKNIYGSSSYMITADTNFKKIIPLRECYPTNLYLSYLISNTGKLYQYTPSISCLNFGKYLNQIDVQPGIIYPIDSLNTYSQLYPYDISNGYLHCGIMLNTDSTYSIFGYDAANITSIGYNETTNPYFHKYSFSGIDKIKNIDFTNSVLTIVNSHGDIFKLGTNPYYSGIMYDFNDGVYKTIQNNANELIPGDNFNLFNFIIIGSK